MMAYICDSHTDFARDDVVAANIAFLRVSSSTTLALWFLAVSLFWRPPAQFGDHELTGTRIRLLLQVKKLDTLTDMHLYVLQALRRCRLSNILTQVSIFEVTRYDAENGLKTLSVTLVDI